MASSIIKVTSAWVLSSSFRYGSFIQLSCGHNLVYEINQSEAFGL